MEYGVLSREIPAASIKELFRKTREYGFDIIHFNYASVTGEEMPPVIEESLNREIAKEAAANKIKIVAVNGTFNMAHPDLGVRLDGIARFEHIASSCRILGCNLVSLCTGTRNTESMWKPHPDNNTPEAWKDMAAVMEKLILIAQKFNINLGIETEASNIINSAEKARKLLDDFKSSNLKIILDAANLFREGTAWRKNVRPVIANAIKLLGPWIALSHGKDIMEGNGIVFTGPGKGIVDFPFFMKELEKAGYSGGIILHGMKDPKDIPGCMDFMKNLVP